MEICPPDLATLGSEGFGPLGAHFGIAALHPVWHISWCKSFQTSPWKKWSETARLSSDRQWFDIITFWLNLTCSHGTKQHGVSRLLVSFIQQFLWFKMPKETTTSNARIDLCQPWPDMKLLQWHVCKWRACGELCANVTKLRANARFTWMNFPAR